MSLFLVTLAISSLAIKHPLALVRCAACFVYTTHPHIYYSYRFIALRTQYTAQRLFAEFLLVYYSSHYFHYSQ